MDEITGIVLFLCILWSTWGLLIVLLARAAREAKVGESFHRVREASLHRPALLALSSGLALIVLAFDAFPSAFGVAPLVLAGVMTVLMPDARDRALGERGVSSGWTGVRYEEIAEWRLTGKHLRFKLRDEWTAVEIPEGKHARVRSILERVAPERESPFRD